MRSPSLRPGLARVGYGVIEIDPQQGLQRLLDCGILRTEPCRSEGQRMVEISRDLRQLVRSWRSRLAGVEKFFFY
ncbi:MAG: crossover junction endodeoxyribonuclease RuvC, partial [Prochlorococcaceae cyanobacterium]